MATAEPNSGSGNNTTDGDDNTGAQANANFECNICLDTAKDAVISMCGHLFCWPCLHQWLETRPNNQMCPVCKAAISRDKVIPLYGRGSSKQDDPRERLPPRPAGQRTEPETSSGFLPSFNIGEGGFQFHFGIGAFPFGFFTMFNNQNGPVGPMHPAPSGHQQQDERFLSSVFMAMALLFLVWLVLL